MKNKLWRRAGRILFYVTWPGIWLIVRLSPGRTRVLVIHDGHLLLVKDWLGNGKWKLPGGGLHHQEDPLIGAIRELQEEVSITAKPGSLTHLADFKTNSNNIATNIYAYTLHLKKRPEVVCQLLEISDYTWSKIDEIDENKISFIKYLLI